MMSMMNIRKEVFLWLPDTYTHTRLTEHCVSNYMTMKRWGEKIYYKR